MLNVFEELKFFDLQTTDATLSVGDASTHNLVQIAQGQTAVTRVGQKIVVKSFQVTIDIFAQGADGVTAASTGRPIIVTFAVVLDKQHNNLATVPLVTELFKSPTAGWTTRRDLDHTARYQILFQKTIVMRSYPPVIDVAGSGYHKGYPPVNINFYKKLSPPLLFDFEQGTTSGIPAAFTKNWLVAMTYNRAVPEDAAQDISIVVNSRTRYVD